MEKSEDVTIVQITGMGQSVFGLGDDQKVYIWRETVKNWELFLTDENGN